MDIAMLIQISLVLVYLIMASQFESLKMPFIIMFSIPFAFSGIAMALFITETPLSVISGIGAVMLIGIVVKNAIVLVDFINLMRERGHELYEAIAISGRSRLRPVVYAIFSKHGERNKNIAIYSEMDFMDGDGNGNGNGNGSMK